MIGFISKEGYHAFDEEMFELQDLLTSDNAPVEHHQTVKVSNIEAAEYLATQCGYWISSILVRTPTGGTERFIGLVKKVAEVNS